MLPACTPAKVYGQGGPGGVYMGARSQRRSSGERGRGRCMQVYRHSLEPGAQPECIFEESDEKYYVTISKTADKQLILIHAAASMQNEIRFLRSDDPQGVFQVQLGRAPA